MFLFTSRAEKFTRQIDFDDEISSFKQNCAAMGTPSGEILPALEHDLIARVWMTDFWATVAMMPSPQFEGCSPGSPHHRMMKDNRSSLAHQVVARLQSRPSPSEILEEAGEDEGLFSVLMQIVPMVIAKGTMDSESYGAFVLFENGCWTFKSLTFQRAVTKRIEQREGPWTKEEIFRISTWVDTKVIPRFYGLKKTKAWDEIEVTFKLKE